MRSTTRIFLLLSLIVFVAAADSHFIDICREKAPDPEDHFFVCLEANSTQFLDCHLPEEVYFLRPCPPGLVCSYTVGLPTEFNPCIEVSPLCGDGVVDAGEQCDGGVGCSDACTCLDGFVPETPPAPYCVPVSQPVCGDGIVNTAEEECDSGAGCSAQCTCLDGYVPQSPPAPDCVLITGPICGNGILETPEQCEIGGDGCSAQCTCLAGWEAAAVPSIDCVRLPVCGNGILEQGESCDSGIGCDAQCRCSAGYVPTEPLSESCQPVEGVCGNGVIEPPETCEIGGVGCSSQCQCLPGYIPTDPISQSCVAVPVGPFCGDGIVQYGEECEIGGLYCTSLCLCAAGSVPTFPISKDCLLVTDVPRCGNGVVEPSAGELCDGGEGCTELCLCEEGYIPTSPISTACRLVAVEEPVCGNDVLEGSEECDGGFGCDFDCTCIEGFVPTEPRSTACRFFVEAPVCGDGIVNTELGEVCEIGGLGCTLDCRCAVGFTPTTPPSFNCAINVSEPLPTELRDICEALTESDEDSGYVCLEANATEYLRCHLMEEVAYLMPCPAGTRCKATVDTFSLYNPCLWEDDLTDPVIVTATPPVSNATLLCDLYGTSGYFCAAAYGLDDDPTLFVQCGEDGVLSGVQQCPPGTICLSEQFTTENPCGVSVAEPQCGNGIVEGSEECDSGVGCIEGSCVCDDLYFASDPPGKNCLLDVEEICRRSGEYTSNNRFFCPAAYNTENSSWYVLCTDSVAVLSQCPDGTFCSVNDGDPRSVVQYNPCMYSAPVCGNGEVEYPEECEAGGNGCSSETCQCMSGYQHTTPPSIDCVPILTGSYGTYGDVCESLGTQGFYCASEYEITEESGMTDKTFVYCGADGVYEGAYECPSNAVCEENFTLYNPCKYLPQCGNGIVEEGEECEYGDVGCDENTCLCAEGFRPLEVAPWHGCAIENATAICLDYGLGDDAETKAVCIDGVHHHFLLCDANGAEYAHFVACPYGTTCIMQEGDVVPCH